MKYIRALDGIRAIAIVLVMLFHFYYLLEVGWVGVQLFFVLSGYLITSILLNSKDKDLAYYLKKFYWRRALRIFPLYYLYLFFILVIFLVSGFPAYFKELAPYLFTYTYNYYPLVNELILDAVFTHFWSLSVEEQFYLFWPFVVYFLSKKQLRGALIFFILLSPLMRCVFGEILFGGSRNDMLIGQIIYRLTPSHIDAFAVGALIPVFDIDKLGNKKKYFIFIPILVFIAVGLLNYSFIKDNSFISFSSLGYPNGGVANYQHVWSYTLINFASLSIIVAALFFKKGSLFNYFLSNAVLVNIGRISYGMYVYHWIILAFIKKYGKQYIQNDIMIFVLYFMLTYFISLVSYKYFEQIFIKLKSAKFKD